MLDKQVLVLLTLCTWPSLGGIIHLDGLADDHNPVSTVVFTEFIKDAPDVRITNRIPVKVPVPHLFPVNRVQTVEVPQPRPYPVDSPYPVPVSQPVPYAVPQEVPVPVSKPFPWPVPQPVPFPVSVSGDQHQSLEASFKQSSASPDSVTTGPAEVTNEIPGSYVPQYQTSTEQASESPQQTDVTSTTSSTSQPLAGNPSSGSSYSASTAADEQYVSEFLPLLRAYLDIFQQPTGQTGEPLQSQYALQFPVQNESNTTLENISGAQTQSGTLTLPTVGNYLGYAPLDHAALSLQSPGVLQTVLFTSHTPPDNGTALQQQEAPESGSTTGQLITTQGTTTFPTSGNYPYSSQFLYPSIPQSDTNNILPNSQLYPQVFGFPSPQSTLVNQIPGVQSTSLDAANSGSSTQQGTSPDFRLQNYQTYDSFQNLQNYFSQESLNAQLISLQNLFTPQSDRTSPTTTVVSESPREVPVPSPATTTGGTSSVVPETTESPQTIATTAASSDPPPAPLNISTAAPPVTIQPANPPSAKEAISPSGDTLKDPEPLSEPPTTTTTTTTTTAATTTVTQLDEKLPVTTAEPETTTTTTTLVVRTSPTPVVTTTEPQIIQIPTQLQPKPTTFLDPPQYGIISLPFVQPQLLTLPQQQQQRQQLQVVVTQI